ncbi:MAG: hypothetical protein M3P11_10745 [Actinomycetota bacterium]|nr:hypothetical protein [Actinomycetota bacterium]
MDWKKVPEAENLARENARLRQELDDSWSYVRDACDSQLATLANHLLRLNDTDRISLYKHERDIFVISGRYSKNPEYAKPGRPFYPDSEGCIMRAWQQGEAFVDDLPDPESHQDAYVADLVNNWQMPLETAQNLRMKSRTLYARALEDPSGMNRTAVLVVESVEVAAFDVSDLQATMASEEGRHILEFLEKRRAQAPDPAFAMREGF